MTNFFYRYNILSGDTGGLMHKLKRCLVEIEFEDVIVEIEFDQIVKKNSQDNHNPKQNRAF